MPKPYVGQLPKVLAAAKCLPKVLAPKHPARHRGLRFWAISAVGDTGRSIEAVGRRPLALGVSGD